MTTTGSRIREQRFTALFRAHYGDVHRYALRRVGAADAHDVTEEVFAAAWRHLDRVPEPALPWLYRAAWHAVGNRRRAAQRTDRLLGRLGGEAMTAAAGRDPADRAVETDAVLRALRQLSPRDQEAVRLCCWENLSPAVAATVLGCTQPALKVRLHRARRRLAAHLSADHDATPGQPRCNMEATP